MLQSGAEVIIKCLKEQGVDVIFGYPGGQVLPIYDALYGTKEIRHILTAHEQGATHAADGYARATGRVGVVIATSGPGATNTVTGIATAFMDSVPLVVITGQVPQSILGKASFQEVDITSITKAITKKNFIVKDANRLAQTIREAFKLARSGRPGPVLIDIPKDIQVTEIEYEEVSIDTSHKVEWDFHKEVWNKEILNRNLENAVDKINSCTRPLIYAGGGVIISGATKELLEFAEKLNCPVTCSLMGMGAFPQNHPLYTGMIGMHGTKASNIAATECDLLIAIGVRFSDRVTGKTDEFAPKADVIHIEIDPAEIGKNVEAKVPLCGDVKAVINTLLPRVNDRKKSDWNDKIDMWKGDFPPQYSSFNKLNPHEVIRKLSELTENKAIITTEVGQNQMWTAQSYTFVEPRTFISSGGLGTMGYGLPASIGACVAKPDMKVVNMAGDGSFRMNSTELVTISKYRLPIVQLLFNNSALGMVRQWQDLFFNKRFSNTSLGDEVNYAKLAEAYNIKAFKITCDEEIEDVLKKALRLNEPVLVECIIDCDEKVFPIVPPGAPITDYIESDIK